MKSSEGFVRMRTLQGVVLFIFLLIAGRLAYIQLVDSKYNELAKANVLRHVVQYPPRGEVFDRNGEYLVQSRECYDLMGSIPCACATCWDFRAGNSKKSWPMPGCAPVRPAS